MATGDRFVPYAVDVDNGGALTDVWIDQITAQSLNPSMMEALRNAGAAADPTMISMHGGQPSMMLSTSALATVLTGVGISCLEVEGDVDEAGVVAYWEKMQASGVRASGSVHLSATMKRAIVVPRTLTAEQDADASFDLEIIGISDDVTCPVIMSVTAALPATANVVGEAFTVGPVTLSTGAIADPTRITLDFGIALLIDKTEGLPWPRYVVVQTRQPEIRIGCRDLAQINTLGIAGSAFTSGSFYLRGHVAGGIVAADGVAAHIKVSWYTGAARVESLAQDAPGQAELVIRPIYDGTHAILTIATGQTIS